MDLVGAGVVELLAGGVKRIAGHAEREDNATRCSAHWFAKGVLLWAGRSVCCCQRSYCSSSVFTVVA
jgi:hypothetical protein